MLYGRLDELRETAAARRARALLEAGGTPQARGEREARAALYTDKITQLDAVENRLCFGRLDLDGGDRRYIGRLGIVDPEADYAPLLVDWRAEAARPFYLATAVAPQGVRRRRHLRTTGRRVVDLQDEVLDIGAAGGTAGMGSDAGGGTAGTGDGTNGARPDGDGEHSEGWAGSNASHSGGEAGLVSEAALLAAVNERRTGQMKDIVETIQADQDRVIRSGHTGMLVVQGGPGTGKTAIALHRAAYLLYTHREQLSKRGVLIVGPNETFLRYIERVLPSLGETSVLLATPGELYPGLRAVADEPAEAARLKGDVAMAQVVEAAVRDRQQVPEAVLDITFDGGTVPLDPATVAAARHRARHTRLPHNQAREMFAREIINTLARQMAERMSDDVSSIEVPKLDTSWDPFINEAIDAAQLLNETDIEEIAQELRAAPGVWAAIDELWPVLTPQRLLTELFGNAERLRSAAPDLTDAEREVLLRERPGREADHSAGHTGAGRGSGDRGGAERGAADRPQWTPADVPLLDEAAEQLGTDDRAARARARRATRARSEYAQGVLEILSGSESMEFEDEESEILTANDLIAADELALRHASGRVLSAAEQGASDRRWAFGHVIVDEAQELSAMAWRMLMRRCPSRSMTIVGDVTQTSDPAGTDSWQRVLAPYVGDRWRLAELRVNYRTPAEVMTLAARVLAEIDPAQRPPRSVRDTGIEPWRISVGVDEFAERLAELAAAEAAGLGGGRLAVLVPASRLEHVAHSVRAVIPDAGVGADARLERAVVVLTVRQAKGLEFDSVLVADPQRILAESVHGAGDLYVALTRTTQRLGVVHPGDVPAALAGARPRELPGVTANSATDRAGDADTGSGGDQLPNGTRRLSNVY